MQVRRVIHSDLKQILDLYQHLNPSEVLVSHEEKIEQTWNEILNSPYIRFYVLEKDLRILSTCVMSIIPNLSRGCAPYGLVENVVTDKNFRRQGLATQFL
jgi:hypothetical protein